MGKSGQRGGFLVVGVVEKSPSATLGQTATWKEPSQVQHRGPPRADIEFVPK